MLNINPRKMNRMMKQLGMKVEEIDAEEVIIKTHEKNIIIQEPHVSKVNFQGQETFQISGKISEDKSKEDLQIIMEKTGCSENEARAALEKTGDIAKAIIELKK